MIVEPVENILVTKFRAGFHAISPDAQEFFIPCESDFRPIFYGDFINGPTERIALLMGEQAKRTLAVLMREKTLLGLTDFSAGYPDPGLSPGGTRHLVDGVLISIGPNESWMVWAFAGVPK